VSDPFETVLCGGSRRTGIAAAEIYSDVTTAAGKASGHRTFSSALETRSSFDLPPETLFLCGGDQSTAGMGKRASNARSSATRVRSSLPSLSDRLTQSLIAAGLVCGITPLSIRQLSGQPIRVLALDMPAGPAVASQSAASSSFKDPAHDPR
jgi:hypothetical protein